MKNIRLFSVILLIFAGLLNAQKIGVVDTDYILSKLPQYKEAEARLNSQITSWQTEIQTLQTEFDKKKAALENERVLLVGDQLKQREKEVDDLDKKIPLATVQIEWKSEWESGNQKIDKQHRELVNFGNELIFDVFSDETKEKIEPKLDEFLI